jgi:CDP-2,3-bis-(O-geranylgeranyl)-sn-glycerol synthase
LIRLVDLLYLMLPVYAANMAPPFVRFWPLWNAPISRRWLGDHKTVLGFSFGIIAAIVTTHAQSWIAWDRGLIDYGLIDYDRWLPLGFALGCGAMFGDSAKSFLKRRLSIAPGHSWIPADQLDFVIGGLIVLAFWIDLTALDIAWILAFSFVADIAVNHAAYRLHIRDTRW